MNKLLKFLKENKHWYLAFYFLFFATAFFAFEKLGGAKNYFDTATAIDDKIPFLEGFIVFYCLWYPSLAAIGLYTLFFEKDAFKRFMYFIIIGYTVSFIIWIIFPSMQSLRPAEFERSNFFTWLTGCIYSADTCTNVYPSVHVVGALGVLFAAFDCKKLRKPWIMISGTVFTVLVCISTVFVKQHAFIDIIGGLVLSLIDVLIVYLPPYIKAHKGIKRK